MKTNLQKILILGVFVFFFSFFYSYSQDVSTLQNQINDRSSQIKKLQAEIDAYTNQVAGTEKDAKDLKSAISNLESQKSVLLNQINLTNLKIVDIQDNISNTVDNISQNKSQIDKNKESLSKSLLEMKINEDNNTFFVNILGNEGKTFSSFLEETFRLQKLNEYINKKVNDIHLQIDSLNTSKNIYEKQKTDLSNFSKDLSIQKTLVAQNQSSKNTLLVETKNKEKNYLKLIADRKKKVSDLESEITSFESKIKYILDKSKLPTAGSSPFQWPLSKFLITQYFGKTSFSSTGAYNGNGHNGIDFGVPVGTPLYAIGDGVIMGTGNTDEACPRASYGKWVLIKHKNGISSLYGHMSIISVSPGQTVKAGEQIGRTGYTGYATGPHLHLTLMVSEVTKIFGPKEYKSRTCGTYLIMPYAPLNAYLNPADYLPKK
ncbi:MAG: peptidoglycan DD-metalloendopeptidase family protein [Candidatus Pacebacteria bacterium]|nr:peptidoglycan DD-metalloendopeptidase family protein [Candidatus Paceibacterota bacterium]